MSSPHIRRCALCKHEFSHRTDRVSCMRINKDGYRFSTIHTKCMIKKPASAMAVMLRKVRTYNFKRHRHEVR